MSDQSFNGKPQDGDEQLDLHLPERRSPLGEEIAAEADDRERREAAAAAARIRIQAEQDALNAARAAEALRSRAPYVPASIKGRKQSRARGRYTMKFRDRPVSFPGDQLVGALMLRVVAPLMLVCFIPFIILAFVVQPLFATAGRKGPIRNHPDGTYSVLWDRDAFARAA